MRALLAGLLLLTVCAPAAALDPDAFEADFELSARGFVIARVTWRLERVAQGFVFESRSRSVGVAALLSDERIVERSEWTTAPGAPRPQRYRYTRTGRRDRTTAVDFDWADGSAVAVANGDRVRYPIPAGTLDGLSYVLAVQADLRAGETQMRYDVAAGRGLREFVFYAGPRETLDTALGAVEAVRVTRERADSERETVLWLAPSLDFVPVRIEHRERDGEALTITIAALRR